MYILYNYIEISRQLSGYTHIYIYVNPCSRYIYDDHMCTKSCHMSYYVMPQSWILRRPITWRLLLARATALQCSATRLDKTRQDSTRQGTFLSNSPEFRGGGRDVARTVWITSPEHVAIPWCRQVEDVRVGYGLALPTCYVCTVSTVKELTELSLCFSNSVPLNKSHRAPSCRLPHAGLHLI